MSEYDDRAEKAIEKNGLKISITKVGPSKFPGERDGAWRFKYQVQIIRDGQGSITFPFYDSVANYEKNERPTKKDVLVVFLGEALNGFDADSKGAVMDSYGYDDPKEADRVYKGLKRMQEKAERLGFSADEVGDILNYVENGE